MDALQILDLLDESRERLLVAIAPLPDEALERPGVMGDWSVKDILAHLAAWESELVTGLMHINQGQKPARMLEAFQRVDEYNAERYAENKDRELNRVFDDFQNVRLQLEQWLEEFSERDLTDPNHYPWSRGVALAHIVKENSYGHEDEHLPAIESFAGRWVAEHGPAEENLQPDE
ncbi:MAG: ClbS/DfsB family four-helix bundle protein [Chloroflexi bacterium]|nr:ClbS/DfsB family four-helix bundle protein [Chloroflexota bacterium]MCI0580424.1 ClbS/DfsB family four-helix bundle protein [Chloroflexota bacterium]MCI0649952.1 ClbS/DfsB family four-helix bundle protein [Chloroflexota bacterium]